MRKSFERNIFEYSDLAKDEIRIQKTENRSEEELEKLESAIEWRLKKGAELRKSSEESQKEIYKIQKQKQKIMEKLKEIIANLDNPNYVINWGENAILIKSDNDKFFIEKDGIRQNITLGEMMTDKI